MKEFGDKYFITLNNIYLIFIWLNMKQECTGGLFHTEIDQNFVAWPNTANEIGLKKKLMIEANWVFWKCNEVCFLLHIKFLLSTNNSYSYIFFCLFISF